MPTEQEELLLKIQSEVEQASQDLRRISEQLKGLGVVADDSKKAVVGLAQSFNQAYAQIIAVNQATDILLKAWRGMTGMLRTMRGMTLDQAAALGQYAQHLRNVNVQLGVSTQFYQALESTLNRLGLGAEKARTSMFVFNRAIAAAREGASELVAVFNELHVSFAEGRSVEDIFLDTARAIASLDDSTKQALLSARMFGYRAREMGIVFKELQERGLAPTIEKMRELGEMVDTGMSEAALAFDAQGRRITGATKGIQTTIQSVMVEAFTPFQRSLANLSESLAIFTKTHEKDLSTLTTVIQHLTAALIGPLGLVVGIRAVVRAWQLLKYSLAADAAAAALLLTNPWVRAGLTVVSVLGSLIWWWSNLGNEAERNAKRAKEAATDMADGMSELQRIIARGGERPAIPQPDPSTGKIKTGPYAGLTTEEAEVIRRGGPLPSQVVGPPRPPPGFERAIGREERVAQQQAVLDWQRTMHAVRAAELARTQGPLAAEAFRGPATVRELRGQLAIDLIGLEGAPDYAGRAEERKKQYDLKIEAAETEHNERMVALRYEQGQKLGAATADIERQETQIRVDASRTRDQLLLAQQQIFQDDYLRNEQQRIEQEIEGDRQLADERVKQAQASHDLAAIEEAAAARAQLDDVAMSRRIQLEADLTRAIKARADTERGMRQQVEGLTVSAFGSPEQQRIQALMTAEKNLIRQLGEQGLFSEIKKLREAFARFIEEARAGSINLGDVIGDSIGNAIEGIVTGSLKSQNAFQAIADSMRQSWAKALREAIKEKLHFDEIINVNFLQTLPGMVAKGAGKIGSVFQGLFKFLGAKGGGGPVTFSPETGLASGVAPAGGGLVSSLFSTAGAGGPMISSLSAAEVQNLQDLDFRVGDREPRRGGGISGDVSGRVQEGGINAAGVLAAAGVATAILGGRIRDTTNRDIVQGLGTGIAAGAAIGGVPGAVVGGLVGVVASPSFQRWISGEKPIPENIRGGEALETVWKQARLPVQGMITYDIDRWTGYDTRGGMQIPGMHRWPTYAQSETAAGLFPGLDISGFPIEKYKGTEGAITAGVPTMPYLLEAAKRQPGVEKMRFEESLTAALLISETTDEALQNMNRLTNTFLLLGVNASEARRELQQFLGTQGITSFIQGVNILNTQLVEGGINLDTFKVNVEALGNIFKDEVQGLDIWAIALDHIRESAQGAYLDFETFEKDLERALAFVGSLKSGLGEALSAGIDVVRQAVVQLHDALDTGQTKITDIIKTVGQIGPAMKAAFGQIVAEALKAQLIADLVENIITDNPVWAMLISGKAAPSVVPVLVGMLLNPIREQLTAAGVAIGEIDTWVNQLLEDAGLAGDAIADIADQIAQTALRAGLSVALMDPKERDARARERQIAKEERDDQLRTLDLAIERARLFGDEVEASRLEMERSTVALAELPEELSAQEEFMNAVRDGLREAVIEGLVQGFLASEVIQNAIKPFLKDVQGIIDQYIGGHITFEEAQAQINRATTGLDLSRIYKAADLVAMAGGPLTDRDFLGGLDYAGAQKAANIIPNVLPFGGGGLVTQRSIASLGGPAPRLVGSLGQGPRVSSTAAQMLAGSGPTVIVNVSDNYIMSAGMVDDIAQQVGDATLNALKLNATVGQA